MIKEIAKFIELKTSFVINVNLLIGHRPQDAIDRCSVILETAGGGVYFDLPDRVDKSIQILSRGNPKYYFQARDDAWAIFNVLHGTAGWDLPIIIAGIEYEAQVIEANSDPQYIGQDEKLRYEFSTNYVFKIRNK